MYYRDDRSFTDNVHNKIAVPMIYSKLGWHDSYSAPVYEDNNFAVDYHAFDINNREIIIQERFRRSDRANNFTDFTLRYQRPSDRQHFSEFFKMLQTVTTFTQYPYFMVYGVVTYEHKLLRFAVIDLVEFFEAIENHDIIVGARKSIFSKVEDHIFFSGLGFNKDYSSSFVSFDVPLLKEMFPSMIILSEGF